MFEFPFGTLFVGNVSTVQFNLGANVLDLYASASGKTLCEVACGWQQRETEILGTSGRQNLCSTVNVDLCKETSRNWAAICTSEV